MNNRSRLLAVLAFAVAAAPAWAGASLSDDAVSRFLGREQHSLSNSFAAPLAAKDAALLRQAFEALAGPDAAGAVSALGYAMKPEDLAAAAAEARAATAERPKGYSLVHEAAIARALARQDLAAKNASERAANAPRSGGVSFDNADPKSRVSVVFVGGGARTGETQKTLYTGGGYVHIAPSDRAAKGGFGADLGLIYTGAGQRSQLLDRETLEYDRNPYGDSREIIREVRRNVTGSNIFELAGVNYETKKFGRVSLEIGGRAGFYRDDPRAKIEETITRRYETWEACYDSEGYRIAGGCRTTHDDLISRETLHTSPGVNSSGAAGSVYGAANVNVAKNFEMRVEAGKTKAGVLSSNNVRVGGRISW